MPDLEMSMWPRAEHLQRVFQVRSGKNSGTAFALDIDGRQYLASALHVVEESTQTASLDIYCAGAWKAFVVNTVGTNAEFDIAVFALAERVVAADLAIEINSAGCAAGQEVFILGYPLGIRGYPVGAGFPLPVIKRGVASLFHPGPPPHLFISASANPGFSGGPVYFADHKTGKATLIAVVVEALAYEVPVKNAKEKIGKVLTDANIVRCSYVDHVLNLIRANPIGFQL